MKSTGSWSFHASSTSRLLRASAGSAYLSDTTSPCSVSFIDPSSTPHGDARTAGGLRDHDADDREARRRVAELDVGGFLGHRKAHGRDQFVGGQRGLVEATEEGLGRYVPPTIRAVKMHYRTAGQRDGRILRSRVRQGGAAADRAAVADGGVRDVRHGLRKERRVPSDLSGAQDLHMARQCADPQPCRSDDDAAQLRQPRDVHEKPGLTEAEVESGDEALPASQHASIRTMLGQRREDLADVASAKISEGCGFHLDPIPPWRNTLRGVPLVSRR